MARGSVSCTAGMRGQVVLCAILGRKCHEKMVFEALDRGRIVRTRTVKIDFGSVPQGARATMANSYYTRMGITSGSSSGPAPDRYRTAAEIAVEQRFCDPVDSVVPWGHIGD